MSQDIFIRIARQGDAVSIAGMLRELAKSLGEEDLFHSKPETIRNHGFGPDASFQTLLAEKQDQVIGMVLFFRHFSTYRGQSGIYVQDLWIDPTSRRLGLGVRLLASAADFGMQKWNAKYLSLSVHTGNSSAARLYEKLGFKFQHEDRIMSLGGSNFQSLTTVKEAGA